ncbi:MAG: ribulose-phosphate 3-epimerase [Elusimicrobiota bacterium]
MSPQRTVLAASILAADPLHLGAALKDCEATGEVDWVHVDVMDGNFTPNLSFGPDIVRAIRAASRLYVDVHLMVERPMNTLAAFIKSGAHSITVHAEALDPAAQCLRAIRQAGIKAGIVIKPATPVSAIEDLIPLADLVLVMSVEPGYSGQSFRLDCMPKMAAVRDLIRARGLDCRLQADGGVAVDTIPHVLNAGADVLVCGSSLFKDGPRTCAPLLRRAVDSCLREKKL